MVRGLDGFFDSLVALCGFEGHREGDSHEFPVVMARGKHLFPFRTEQLSPSAPMVLGPQGPGRVGRRRFDQYTGRPEGGPSSLGGRSAPEDPSRTAAPAPAVAPRRGRRRALRPLGGLLRRLGEREDVPVGILEPHDFGRQHSARVQFGADFILDEANRLAGGGE